MSGQDRRTGRRGFLKQRTFVAAAVPVTTSCGTGTESGGGGEECLLMTMRSGSRQRHRGGRRSATPLCERKAALGRAPVFLNRFDWPAYDTNSRPAMIFDVESRVEHNQDAELLVLAQS